MSRTSRNLFLAVVAALALSACGKKGALETPKPSSEVAAPVNPDGTPRTSGPPFILDPLVR